MAHKKNLVVKVKYPTHGGDDGTLSAPQTVTEWNVKRLMGAGVVLIFLLLAGYCGLSAVDSEHQNPAAPEQHSVKPGTEAKPTSTAPALKIPSETSKTGLNEPKSPDKTIKFKLSDAETVMTSQEMTELKETIKRENDHSASAKPEKTETTSSISSSKQVVRSVLAQQIVKREPVSILENSIKIPKGKSITINYFTELKGMNRKVVFHEWLKNQQTVFRRRIVISGNRWRTASRKTFNQTSAGAWEVRTVDEKNHLLDQKDFNILVR